MPKAYPLSDKKNISIIGTFEHFYSKLLLWQQEWNINTHKTLFNLLRYVVMSGNFKLGVNPQRYLEKGIRVKIRWVFCLHDARYHVFASIVKNHHEIFLAKWNISIKRNLGGQSNIVGCTFVLHMVAPGSILSIISGPLNTARSNSWFLSQE